MTPTSSTSPGTASFRKRPKTRSGSSHWKPMSSNTKVNRGCSASGAPNRGASSRCSTPYGKAEYASSRPTRLRSVNNSRTSKGDKHAERSDYDSKIQNRSRRGCLVGQPSEYSRGDHGTSLENRRREKEGPPQDRHHAVAHGGPGGGSGHRQPQRTSVPNLYQDGAARGSAKGAPVRLIGPAPAGAFATALRRDPVPRIDLARPQRAQDQGKVIRSQTHPQTDIPVAALDSLQAGHPLDPLARNGDPVNCRVGRIGGIDIDEFRVFGRSRVAADRAV